MSGNSFNEIDFKYWATLASTDPQKFEQLRKDKITALIERAASQRKPRLRGLQWKIDLIRAQHKDSTMAACLAISELMWETFEHLAVLLQAQAKKGLTATTPAMQATIIPFPVKSES